MAKPYKEPTPKPDDFEPELKFPDDWPDKSRRGKHRCPAWSKQSAAQCGQVAGSGTSRHNESGAVCKYHGGASSGPPLGNTNAVKSDLPGSRFVRVDDLPLLEQFKDMSPKDRADLLSNIMLMRAAKTLQSEAELTDEEAKTKQVLFDGRLIELAKAADRSLRTVATFMQIENAADLNGSDDDDNGADGSRVETAFGLLEQLGQNGDGEEDS